MIPTSPNYLNLNVNSFRLNKIKIHFLRYTSHISNAYEPCVADGYHIRNVLYPFPLLHKFLLDSAILCHLNNSLITKYNHTVLASMLILIWYYVVLL